MPVRPRISFINTLSLLCVVLVHLLVRFGCSYSRARAALLFWSDELALSRVGAYSFKELVPLALQCYQFAIDVRSC